MTDNNKLKDTYKTLKEALKFEEKAKKSGGFYSAGIAKSFEICFEYAWKYMKHYSIEHGLEVYSPRDAIKTAGQLGLIEDVELWFGFLEDRNLSVHDYIGIDNKEYLFVKFEDILAVEA